MKLEDQLGEWYNTPLKYEFSKQYMQKLIRILQTERRKYTIRPHSDDVFRAYRLTSLQSTKVVLLGQDPYPHEHADGLAFSSSHRTFDTPASLENIFEELNNDLGYQLYHNPDLSRWARQGVLLINTALTCRDKQAGSHHNIGWKRFTRKVMELISDKEKPVVFLLWGKQAQFMSNHIDKDKHHLIFAPHPSPYQAHRGFFGHKPFSRTNKFLAKHYNSKIKWKDNE